MIKEERSTFSERKALEKMINYIEEERNRLWEEYKVVVKRLGALDEQDKEEMKLNHELSLKEENTSNEEEPEADTKEQPTEGKTMVMSVQEAIDKHNNRYSSDVSFNVPSDKKLELNHVAVKTPTRKSHYRDLKQLALSMVAVLKDKGIPMKLSDVSEELEKRGYNTHRLGAVMPQVLKHTDKISKAGHGYYQYKW